MFLQNLNPNMSRITHYLSLIKFSHTIFAMPFALVGFFLGDEDSKGLLWSQSGRFLPVDAYVEKLILVILCMVFARSAAMAFNRYLDRSFDALNPRTAIREIPSGKIKAGHALIFTLISSVAFILFSAMINNLCFYLSFPALFVVLSYSYTKRFTALCHLILGLGLSLAPIGSYLAVTGFFNMIPVLFSFLVIGWVSGFDIIYALQDKDFDESNQLHSIPVLFGKKQALTISRLLHMFTAILVISIGLFGTFGLFYWVGGLFFVLMLIWQHALVKPHDLSKVNLAFMTTNGIASVVFAFFVILDLLR
jgi:4-hydroxybenzoate polyprenyltransferase